MDARLLLALFALGACTHEPMCQGPTRAVTPVRDVRAPAVKLAGMPLDVNPEQARRACEAVEGTFQDGAACVLRAVVDQPISPRRINVRFDQFGRAKEISAFYMVGDDSMPGLIQSVVAQIGSVLGEAGSGDLLGCNTDTCARARYAEWQFEGGQVRLESERRDSSLELRLTHSHRDMTEQVQYGLPVCGR